MYKRFKLPTELSWDGKIPILSNKKPSKIFVCSTMEMFHPQVPKEWRDRIFNIIQAEHNQKHTFQILTKMPENIDRPMPDNVHLGVSITGNKTEDFLRAGFIGNGRRKAKIQFVSYEPLLDIPIRSIPNVDWVIIGRLTGHGKKHDPPRWMIEGLVEDARKQGVPIFLKHNLKDIWPGELIQEWPE